MDCCHSFSHCGFFNRGSPVYVYWQSSVDRLHKIRISNHAGHINLYYILIAALAISQYTINNNSLNT